MFWFCANKNKHNNNNCTDKKTGQLAVLTRHKRFAYYLVSKERYFHKPTYETLRSSLQAVRSHCQDNKVSQLAMPKIGCGLDRLSWDKVSLIIKEVFQDLDMTVTVYYL